MATKNKSTTDFLPIREIRDGVIVLKDGTICRVLMASSINFALKSADEQIAILAQYQNMLNSLDFSLQLYIQSRRQDIRPYLAILESRMKEQVNELLKIQTLEYMKFVRAFTESTSIMTKTFFVVIPYTPSVISTVSIPTNPLTKLLGGKEKEAPEVMESKAFEEAREQLDQRASVVAQGLSRTGVRIIPLETEELVELFYKIFNPGELERALV